MTHIEALQLVAGVCRQVRLTADDHEKIASAIKLLGEAALQAMNGQAQCAEVSKPLEADAEANGVSTEA